MANNQNDIDPAAFVAELIDDLIEDFPIINELEINKEAAQSIDALIYKTATDLYGQEVLRKEKTSGSGSCRHHFEYKRSYTKLVMDLKTSRVVPEQAESKQWLESKEKYSVAELHFPKTFSAPILDWEEISKINYYQSSWVNDNNPLLTFWEGWRARVSSLDWDNLHYLSQYLNRLLKLWQPRISSWSVFQYSFVDKAGIYARPGGFSIPYLERLSQQLVAQANHFSALCNRNLKGSGNQADLRACHQELKALITTLRPYWHFLSILNKKGHYQYSLFDWPYEHLPRFYWLFPELNLFFDLLVKECSACVTPETYLGHRLSWASLRSHHELLTELRAQIVDKAYSHYGANRDLADICDEMLLQIDHFANWFAEDEIRKHKFQEAHPSAGRATQDLEYLVKVIRMHGDHIYPRLSSGLHGLKDFMEQVVKERELALKNLRIQYKAAVLDYYEMSEAIEKAKVKTEKQARLAQAEQEEAAKVATIKEAACLETLKDIEILIDPTYSETAIEPRIYQKIQGIIDTQKDQRPATANATFSTQTQLAAPAKASVSTFSPKKMTEELLEQTSLKKILEDLKLIYRLLKVQDCKFFGMTKSELERLALVKDLEKCLESIAAMEGKQRPEEQEFSLKVANTALASIFHKLKTSNALFASQYAPNHKKVTDLQKYTNACFRTYEKLLLLELMFTERKLSNLKAKHALLEEELSKVQEIKGQLPMKFFGNKSISLTKAQTAEASLRAINTLIVQSIGTPCSSPYAAKLYQTILQKILDTLAPAKPSLTFHDLARF